MRSIRTSLASLCVLYSMVVAASVRADVIAEGFDQNSAEPIVIADGTGGEKVVRFLSSRFAWGGFCQSPHRGIFTIVDPHGTPCFVLRRAAGNRRPLTP